HALCSYRLFFRNIGVLSDVTPVRQRYSVNRALGHVPIHHCARSNAMTQTQTPNRLHKHMAEVVALEAAIAQGLDQLIMERAKQPEVTAMLREFHAMTKGQLYALDTRLQTLAAHVPIPDRRAAVRPDGESDDGNPYPVSTALQTAYTLFNRALIAYAALQ